MIRRLGMLAAGVSALGLGACEFGSGGDRPGTEGEPRQEAGSANDLVGRMVERGRLPQLEYDCVLIGPDEDDDRPYGRLGVVNDRYTLVLKGGGREEGGMTLAEDRSIRWDGDLGGIDDAPRRVTGGRVNTEDATVELAFDVSPADDAGRDQVVCRADV